MGANAVDQLRERFNRAGAYTVGIEDEMMLLDPDTLALVASGPQLLERLGDDQRFKLELPASQLEIVTPVSRDLDTLAGALITARRTVELHAEGLARPACAGVHPFSPGVGRLNRSGRYSHTIAEYGVIASRQLVCALQVHVAVGDADRALAVYNAARSYLPLLAALAANAPFYEGHDTGLASIRPKLSELLPRQGVPPAFESWEAYVRALSWGATSGAFADSGTWWWELRPHPGFGTLEFRVPDAQSTVADAIAVASVIQALAMWLGERHDAHAMPDAAPGWQISENRWSACRYGVEGSMADLRTGAPGATRDRLHELIEALEPIAVDLGSQPALDHARTLVETNGAIAQRRVAAAGGPAAVAAWMADRFSESPPWLGFPRAAPG
jgi:glutamate---cysteine ligase / carboxylate-amine ligase